MTEKIIYYIKEGRRYKPVHEYDQKLIDSFSKGNHLVQVYPGGSSRRYNIDPAYAPMIAAGRVAEDKISEVIMKATDLRRNYKMAKKMTPGQLKAWNKLIEEFGEDARALEWPSAREACEEAVKAMSIEADKLLEHPAVRKAYDHFMLMCQLTKESKKNES
jgi:glycine/D-amino acid oxidase-like deaminating enzyme